MDRGDDAAVGSDPVEAVEVGQQPVPLITVELGAGVVAHLAGVRGEHHAGRPRRQEGLDRRPDDQRRVDRRVVQDDGDEAADGPHPVLVQHARLLGGLVGQEPVRPELRRAHPEVAHLGEHPVGRQLHTPARDLAHPPADRGDRDPVGQRGPGRRGPACHRRTSSSRTTRPSR